MAKAKKDELDQDGLTPKQKELKEFMESLNKDYGKGTVIKASGGIEPYGDVVPVSSIALSEATGIGGFPKNKIVEIIGWESAGKSTLSNDIIAWAQKTYNDECLLIDKENSFDPFYAEALGVDLNKLELAYPEALEDCYGVIERALSKRLFGVIVVDSLTSFEPRVMQLEDEKKRATGISGEARINSSRLRMINNKIRNSGCLIIIINQLREKVGVMFGNPETTSGGNALKFYAHMRIMIRRKEMSAEDESNVMTFKIIKNKMAPPFREAEMTILWGKGFDVDKEIIDYALEMEIIKKGSTADPSKNGNAWWYDDLKIEDNKEDAIQVLRDNTELLNEIKDKVLNKLRGTEELSSISEEKSERA